jgi:hypothetical protein
MRVTAALLFPILALHPTNTSCTNPALNTAELNGEFRSRNGGNSGTKTGNGIGAALVLLAFAWRDAQETADREGGMNHAFYWRFICDCDRTGQRDSMDGFCAWCSGHSLDNHTETAMTA